jgi:sulfite oxidase
VLTGLAGVTGGALLAGSAGRALAARSGQSLDPASIQLPRPSSPAPPIPATSLVDVPGVTPFLTSGRDFYRVDTALVVPRPDAARWRLRLHGLVDRTVELSYQDLLDSPLVERIVTLTCVSNEVGGTLAGTASWLGLPLADLLARVGVQPEADMMLSRSVDGFTASTPLTALRDGRDALLAVGMNGAPLPAEHGFPARLIVPGLYGFVSATKWVVDLELTRFDRVQAYWTRRGWATEAPIRTASRIDVPKPFARVGAGSVPVAGVAWAQHRGISRVEVSADGDGWHDARLADALDTDTWRQWVWQWTATPGLHTLQVRATGATGALQQQARRPPKPDGATGWHSVAVQVI